VQTSANSFETFNADGQQGWPQIKGEVTLKVHKHEIILNIFFTEIKI
jgi:hypothetical protein